MRGDRPCAAVVALVAVAGLAIQFEATFAPNGSVTDTLWIVLRFFTVLTNMAVALTFAAIALGYGVTPRWLGGVLLAILLVGVVYGLLLRGCCR